jgi:hypothetical protein
MQAQQKTASGRVLILGADSEDDDDQDPSIKKPADFHNKLAGLLGGGPPPVKKYVPPDYAARDAARNPPLENED